MMMIFNSAEELVDFINQLPQTDGSSKVFGKNMRCKDILERLVGIAPKIFNYKAVLDNALKSVTSISGNDFAGHLGHMATEDGFNRLSQALDRKSVV